MTPAAAARVRESYLGFAPKLDALVRAFYSRLFAEQPGLRSMFPASLERQRVHLAASLALLFRNIDCLDTLERPLMELGAQHATWGVRPEHYPMVRDALLWAIEETARPAWGHQLRDDWRLALGRISALMLKGAAAAATEHAPTVVTRPLEPRTAAGPRGGADTPESGSRSPDGR
jgi:nitric oxide dioxygenase